MVANVANSARLDERDDMQHIQTQRLLAMRIIAPPKSRLGKLIEERLAQLYEEFGEKLDPAKRGDGLQTSARPDGSAERDALSIQHAPRTSGAGGAQGRPRLGDNALSPEFAGTTESLFKSDSATSRIPAIRAESAVPQIRRDRPTTQEQSHVSWVMLLHQVLKTDVTRLGVEPSELDDIRVLLIKNEATQYEKLQLLSRLPDSLAPEAVTKIFEDIRTMAAGYIAFVLIERTKGEPQQEEEVKQSLEVPRSVSSPFFGIPIIDFDPADILQTIE